MGEAIDHSKSITNLLKSARGFSQFKQLYKDHLLKNDWADLESIELHLEQGKILIPVYLAGYEMKEGELRFHVLFKIWTIQNFSRLKLLGAGRFGGAVVKNEQILWRCQKI